MYFTKQALIRVVFRPLPQRQQQQQQLRQEEPPNQKDEPRREEHEKRQLPKLSVGIYVMTELL